MKYGRLNNKVINYYNHKTNFLINAFPRFINGVDMELSEDNQSGRFLTPTNFRFMGWEQYVVSLRANRAIIFATCTHKIWRCCLGFKKE